VFFDGIPWNSSLRYLVYKVVIRLMFVRNAIIGKRRLIDRLILGYTDKNTVITIVFSAKKNTNKATRKRIT